jgi:hypothetical protein
MLLLLLVVDGCFEVLADEGGEGPPVGAGAAAAAEV